MIDNNELMGHTHAWECIATDGWAKGWKLELCAGKDVTGLRQCEKFSLVDRPYETKRVLFTKEGLVEVLKVILIKEFLRVSPRDLDQLFPRSALQKLLGVEDAPPDADAVWKRA